jgi:hypothetical protein
MAERMVLTAADRALMHALSYLVAQVVRDATTEDTLGVLDDLQGRASMGNPHVAAMAAAASDLLLHGRPSLRSGMDWALAMMAAGRSVGAYHYAQMAATHGAARAGREATA